MIAELQANPDAQSLLLRALLTSEFLGMPIRLERIEADIAELKAAVGATNTRLDRVETDIGELKAAAVVTNTRLDRLEATMTQFDARLGRVENDVAVLKGDSLEVKLHRRIRSLVSQRLGMRRGQVVQSPVQDTSPELFLPVEEAADNGVITDAQETRLNTTDIILRAQRKSDRAQVWVVVEVSNSISRHDIERVQQSAEALGAVFPQDVLAVVAGYRIHPQDQEQAGSAGVYTILIEESG
jgi:chromosome segregation ATPase